MGERELDRIKVREEEEIKILERDDDVAAVMVMMLGI